MKINNYKGADIVVLVVLHYVCCVPSAGYLIAVHVLFHSYHFFFPLHLISNTLLSREEATAAFQDGQEQLAMLRRQVALGQMYPSGKSVMES